MGSKEVLVNLKNFDSWDYKHYSLRQEEAEVCIAALEKDAGDVAIIECKSCGTPLRDYYNFCPNCGKKVVE